MQDINTSLKMAIQVTVMCSVVFIIITLTMIATAFGRSVAQGYNDTLSQAKINAVYSLEDCAKAVPASTVYRVLCESEIGVEIELYEAGSLTPNNLTINQLKGYFSKKYFVDVEWDGSTDTFSIRMVGA